MNQELEHWNRLVKRQNEIYHQYTRKSGLADTQFWVLYALCEAKEALCQNAFCESWCYSKQTVCAAVASLERSGLIYLTFAEGSRKQKDLHLTQAGESFCDRYVRPLQTAEEGALKTLSDNERERFFQTFTHLLDGLKQELL